MIRAGTSAMLVVETARHHGFESDSITLVLPSGSMAQGTLVMPLRACSPRFRFN